MTSFHENILPQEQQSVLKLLAPATKENGFYLAGGTALAIQLGHRKSMDLDWLTEGELQDPLALAATFRDRGINFKISETARGTLHGAVNGVKTSFIRYHYRLLNPLLEWPEYGCQLAGLDDLICMKLAAVAQRGAKRDFIDIATVGRVVMPLSKMLDLFRQKYSVNDVGHVLMALCYFDDANVEPLPDLIQPIDWEETKATLIRWVKDLVRE